MLSPAQSFDGYRIHRKIGAGGFGEIWVCESEALGDLRALKLVPPNHGGRLDKEFQALGLYRNAAGRLRSPALMPIEHANVCGEGLFYIMPLADGLSSESPFEENWQPKTLASMIELQKGEPVWFSIQQVRDWMTPILEGLQLLSEAGLVHRDVKPDNILFLNGSPCLSDISLLGKDAQNLTRRGTPGFSAPSWFVESGGNPDMFGAAMTLYSLLSGNPPDKMGRANFRWPPQGEGSLSPAERKAWLSMHAAVRRAVDERPAERFADFNAFARALAKSPADASPQAASAGGTIEDLASGLMHRLELGSPAALLAAAFVGFGILFFAFHAAKRGRQALQPEARPVENRAVQTTPQHVSESPPPAQPGGGAPLPESARAEIREFEAKLSQAVQALTFPREAFAAEMDSIAADLFALDPENTLPPGTRYKPISEIKDRFLGALKALPPKQEVSARGKTLAELRAITGRIGSIYGASVRVPLEEKIVALESELNTDSEFRKEQGLKVLKRATALVNIRPESWEIIRPAQNFSFFGHL